MPTVHDRLNRGDARAWARAAGVSDATIYNIASGKRRASEEFAKALAAVAPIPVSWTELVAPPRSRESNPALEGLI